MNRIELGTHVPTKDWQTIYECDMTVIKLTCPSLLSPESRTHTPKYELPACEKRSAPLPEHGLVQMARLRFNTCFHPALASPSLSKDSSSNGSICSSSFGHWTFRLKGQGCWKTRSHPFMICQRQPETHSIFWHTSM